jgi:hypothetical protein
VIRLGRATCWAAKPEKNRAEALRRDRRNEVAAGRGDPVAVMERKIRTGSANKRLVAK